MDLEARIAAQVAMSNTLIAQLHEQIAQNYEKIAKMNAMILEWQEGMVIANVLNNSNLQAEIQRNIETANKIIEDYNTMIKTYKDAIDEYYNFRT